MGSGSTPERPDIERMLFDPKYKEIQYRIDPLGYFLKRLKKELRKR